MCVLVLLCALPVVCASCDWAPPDPSGSSSLSYDRSALRLLLNATADGLPLPSSLSYYVEFVTSECYECAYQWLYTASSSSGGGPSPARAGRLLPYCSLTSRFTLSLRLIDASTYNDSSNIKDVLATAEFELTERGYYTLYVHPTHSAASSSSPLVLAGLDANSSVTLSWELLTEQAGDNAYVALLIVFPVLVVLLLLARALADERVLGPLRSAYSRHVLQTRDGAAAAGGGRGGVAKGALHEPMLANSSEEDEAAQLMRGANTPPSPFSTLAAHSTAAAPAPRGLEAAVPASRERAKPSDAEGAGESPFLAPSTSSSPSPLPGLVARTIRGKERLLSLDTFRGCALSVMIFVNYGGGGYWFFEHAAWNGLTVADLVFPMFVWMMGVSLPLSLQSLEKKGVSRREVLVRVVRRAVILFVLGLAVSNDGGGASTLAQLRLMGVLQRFALSYLIVALILLFSPKLGAAREGARPVGVVDAAGGADALDDEAAVEEQAGQSSASRWRSAARRLIGRPSLREYSHHAVEMCVVLLLVVVHLLVTFTLPVPGCPTGYLGPGGLADGGRYPGCVGGAAGYVDRQLLGYAHIYHNPTCNPAYHCGAYDPEGLLGVLTSAVLCYLGVLAGRSILWHADHRSRLTRWLAAAALCGLLALALCGGRENGGVIPVNKNLWSLSFILTMSAFSFISLAALYLTVDVKRVWDGAPFRPMGQNSILMSATTAQHNTAQCSPPEAALVQLTSSYACSVCAAVCAYACVQLLSQ